MASRAIALALAWTLFLCLALPALATTISPAPIQVMKHQPSAGGVSVPLVVVTPTPVPQNGKAVRITSPAPKSTVFGTVGISLLLGTGVTRVNVFVDGVYLESTPPLTLSWDTRKVKNGAHVLDAEAFNSQGAFLGFDDILINTNNSTPTPTGTRTPARTPTRTPTKKATRTPTRTPTRAATKKPTPSPTKKATPTPKPTPAPTPGPLFVSDQQNNRVLEYKRPFSNGMNAGVVIGQPGFNASFPVTTVNGLNFPWYLAQDSAGNLYVADGGANRVLVFAHSFTTHQSAINVIGQPDFVSSDPATTQSGLSFPAGVAVDKAGDLFVAERSNNRILEFVAPLTKGMMATTVIGQPGFTSNVAATTQSGLSFPAGIALDRVGNLFVADQSNNRVLEFEPPFLPGMKASAVIGQLNFTSRAAAVTANGLSGPLAVALDAAGNLFVADARNNRVLEYKPPFGVFGKSASVVFGQSVFTSNVGGTTASGLVFPAGVGLDGSGNLYVSDNVNDRVLEFEPPFTSGMAAVVVIGEPDLTTAQSNTTQSGLSGPVGLVVKQP